MFSPRPAISFSIVSLKDVELVDRRRAEAGDQHGHFGSRRQVVIVENDLDHVPRDLGGRLQRLDPHPRLAVMADADFHRARLDQEIGMPDGGQRAGAEADADRAAIVDRPLRCRLHFLEARRLAPLWRRRIST